VAILAPLGARESSAPLPMHAVGQAAFEPLRALIGQCDDMRTALCEALRAQGDMALDKMTTFGAWPIAAIRALLRHLTGCWRIGMG
jgi:hypothetical protein